MKANPAPPRVADSLAAANADAQRRFGDGRAQEWRPPPARRRWPTVAVLAAAAALVWAAGWLRAPAGAEPALVVAAAPPQQAPAAIATASPAPVVVQVASPAPEPCAATPCVAAATPNAPAPSHLTDVGGAPAIAWPANPDDWALDPQTIGAPTASPSRTRRALHNVPDIPDDADPTPAEESTDDGESGGGPAD